MLSWDEMAALLPADWTVRQRDGFLRWLSGPSGLLTDRSDGTLVFTHLSFQEYLSAWQLDTTLEGQERVQGFLDRVANHSWWETLLLWAALLGGRRPAWLEEILAGLLARGEDAIALSGM